MKLAVYFPGVGYHCDKPLLYYARKTATACGFDQHITLSYTTKVRDLIKNSANRKAAFLELYEQAEAALGRTAFFSPSTAPLLQLQKNSCFDEILFISKSIGTVIAASYAAEHNIPCRHILYTPLAETFDFQPRSGIAFSGSADPFVTSSVIHEKCHTYNLPLFLYDGANHSLETGDIFQNLDILKDVMQKTDHFIRQQRKDQNS